MSIAARAAESDVFVDINGRTFYFRTDDAEDLASQLIAAVFDARKNADIARKERMIEIRQEIFKLQAELAGLDSADAEEKADTPAAAAPSPWLIDPIVYPYPPLTVPMPDVLGPPPWRNTPLDPLWNPAVGAVVAEPEKATFMGMSVLVDPSLAPDEIRIGDTVMSFRLFDDPPRPHNNDHEQDGA